MVRLFYQKPNCVVLDECTSAVDSAIEAMLYETCRKMGITYITIAHRPMLKAFHDMQLHLSGDGKGGWSHAAIDRDAAMELFEKSRSRTALKGGYSDYTELHKQLDALTSEYSQVARAKLKPLKKGSVFQTLRLVRVMLPNTYRHLLSLIALIGLRTYVSELTVASSARIVGSMVQGQPLKVAAACLALLVQAMVSTFVQMGTEVFQTKLSNKWHEQLQGYVARLWLAKRHFFTLSQIDGRIQDADQILSQEMSDLSQRFTSVWRVIAEPAFDIVWFSWRLLNLLGSQGMSWLVAYNLAVWCLLRFVTPDHSKLASCERETESRYRFVQGRLRDHSESIAFFGGGLHEKHIADRYFDEAVQASLSQKRAEAWYEFFKSSVMRGSEEAFERIISPSMIFQSFLMLQSARLTSSSGAIARGLEHTNQASAFVVDAFEKLSCIFEDVPKLTASANRVTMLINVLEELDSETIPVRSTPDGTLAMENLDLVTPKGVCLAHNVNFTLPPGESMMVTGPNSSGKSACFRVLAGMWPICKGSACRPENMMLVPQKVYSVCGTLMDQVTYPKRHRPRTPDTTSRATEAFRQVGIEYLIEREGWDKEIKFEDVLSLGEQQRIGLARLFFHKPDVGILDECTSAISMEAEEKMLVALHRDGVRCVSMSQRLAMTDLHMYELQLGLPTPDAWSFGLSEQRDFA